MGAQTRILYPKRGDKRGIEISRPSREENGGICQGSEIMAS
jgi:hypothetical protein